LFRDFESNHLISKNVYSLSVCRRQSAITGITKRTKKIFLRVATRYSLKNQDDKKLFETTWHNIVVRGQHPEYAERSYIKGSHIVVDGSIIYNTYPDLNGAHPTMRSTNYLSETTRLYKPDFLVRDKTTNKACIVEINPSGVDCL
jgi:hypothetical protein